MYFYFIRSTLFLLSVLIVVIIDLPSSLCADYYQYSICSKPFNCGHIKNITYPFWGNGRAEYCGHPDFQLECLKDDLVNIKIQAQNYRVIDMVKETRLLHLARIDPWYKNCPTQFANTSLPSYINIYYLHQYLTLFYGCPLIPQLSKINKFPCSLNNIDENYYWDDSVGAPLPELSSCNISVKVIVLRERVGGQNFTGSQLNMEEGLKIGFVVEYVVHDLFCKNCEDSGGACGYNRSSAKPKCYCYDGLQDERCPTLRPIKSTNMRRNIVIALATGIGSVLAATVVFFIWRSKQSPTSSVIFWKGSKKSQNLVEEFLQNYGSLAPKRYNYSDIKKITNSFKDKVGQGGCGLVYKGKLLDGCVVAVKLLNKAEGDGEDFINELGTITRTSHVNIVSLLGFCFEGLKRALIYEFMSNGSLEKFIYNSNPSEAESQLGWKTLYQITIGVARGLEYLHRGCNTRILHFDIKPHNILLDKDFTPKISDFGFAKVCSREESIISMLDARGTVGYIAPEVLNKCFGAVSHKSDVYSFGMMILEIVGQRKVADDVGVDHTAGEIYFPQWIYKYFELNQDLGLGGEMSNEEVDIIKKLVMVALWCIQTSPMDRPDMSRVVEMLEARDEILPIPPKPYLCIPPRSPAESSRVQDCNIN